jgi:hypothetical protein
MPVTDGPQVRSLADIVKAITNCSNDEADFAEKEICKDPAALSKIALACGVSTSALAAGVAFAPKTMGLSLIVAGKAAPGVVKYCKALVKGVPAMLSSGDE